MSQVLDSIREKYPQYKDIPDDELTMRIGSKYPIYLEKDPVFKTEFQNAVGTHAVKAAQQGVVDIYKVLTNSAAGEASLMGQEHGQGERLAAAVKPERPPETGLERAAKLRQEFGKATDEPGAQRPGFDFLTQPFAKLDFKPEEIVDAAREFIASDLRVSPETFGPKPTAERVKQAMEKHPAFATFIGAEKGLADFDSFFTSPIGIATLGMGALPATAQRMIGLAFTAQMASQVPQIAKELGSELGKPEGQRDYQKIGQLVTEAATTTGFTAAGVLHATAPVRVEVSRAYDQAKRFAPMTAQELAKQQRMLLPVKPAEETPLEPARSSKTAQETSKSPARAETPAKSPEANPAPDERVTAATYTNPQTGETSTGEHHPEAAAKQGIQAPEEATQRHGPEYGFEVQDQRTGTTRIVSRDEAESIGRRAGQLIEEPKRGKLHSDEVNYAPKIEKGPEDASKKQEAAEVHGNLRPQPEQGTGQVPVEEGGARVQPQTERGIRQRPGEPAVPQETSQLETGVAPAAEPAKVGQAAGPETIRTPDERKGSEMAPEPGASPGQSPTALIDQAMRLVKTRKLSAEQRSALSRGIEAARQGDAASLQDAIKESESAPKVGKEKPKAQRGFPGAQRFNRETDIVGPDILSWVVENMNLLSRNGARKKWGKEKYELNKSLWDDAPTRWGSPDKDAPHHNFVYSQNGFTPDVVAQAAFEAGALKSPDVNALWAALKKASHTRAGAEARASREAAMIEEEAKAAEQGTPSHWAVTVDDEPYGVFKSESQARMVASGLSGKVEVKPADAEQAAAEMRLEEPGAQILQFPETGPLEEPPPEEPEVEQPQRKAETKEARSGPPAPPKLKDIKERDFRERMDIFHEQRRSWEEGVNDWASKLPENKAAVFQNDRNTYAVTKDSMGGWRYTFWNNKDHMASGHMEYNSKEEAVLHLLKHNEDAKFIGHKMPFDPVPTPGGVNFIGDTVTWRSADGDKQVEFRGYLGGEQAGKAVVVDESGKEVTVDNMDLGPKAKAGEPVEEKEPEVLPVAPSPPKLRSMEKSGELFQGEDQAFNLASETDMDGDRIAAAQLEMERKDAEAKAFELQHQQSLSHAEPEAPLTIETETPVDMTHPTPNVEASEASAGPKALTVGETERPGPITRSGPPPAQAEEGAQKTVAAPAENRTPHEILGESKRVKVKAPEGATMLRVTDKKGKSSIQKLSDVNKGDNVFQGVDIKKIEAGVIGKDKKFKAIKGDVTVEDKIPRGISEGPGGASPGDFPDDSELKQLTDTLKAQGRLSDPRPILDRLRDASEIAEKWAKTKEGAVAAMGKVEAALKAISDAYKNLPAYQDFQKAIGEWQGADQWSAREVRKFIEQINKSVPEKIRQVAITNWIQADGNQDVLRARADASRGSLKRGYEMALTLNDSERTLARQIQMYFESKLEEGLTAGILKSQVENYVTQIWENPNQATDKLYADLFGGGTLNPNFKYARKRIFESYFEGEQLGYAPKDKSIGRLLATYDFSFSRALSARGLIKALHEGVAKDGKPIVMISKPSMKELPGGENVAQAYLLKPNQMPADAITEDGRQYKEIPHWALRDWKWAMMGTRYGEEAPIYMQGNMVVHPDHYSHLSNVLMRSRLQDNMLSRNLLKAQAFAKQTKLSISPFHLTQEGVHAMAHKVLPVNLPEIDPANPVDRSLVSHGLMVEDPRAASLFMEGMTGGGLVGKIPGIGRAQTYFNEWLFRDYIPKLKMAMAKAALERNREVYAKDIQDGKITDDQLLALTARESNAAFGELNYRMMGRNQTLQDFFRLSMLAPDFLEARGRFVGQALKPYGREQLMALARMGVVMWVGSRILNQLLDKDPHWEKPFSVIAGGKEYRLRTVLGDVQHLITDPRNFWYNRFSPSMRTGIEYVTRRDDRGIKRNTWQQLGDFAEWFKPISAQRRPDISRAEQIATSAGISATTYNAQSRIHAIADSWMESNEDPLVRERYQRWKSETRMDSAYTPLRHALQQNDLKRARKAYDELLKTRTEERIDRTMETTRPFTGANSSEAEFMQSLNPKQQRLYDQAIDERRQVYDRFLDMLNTPSEDKKK